MSNEERFEHESDERLQALLAEVGRDDHPPADWQARVWRQIEARRAPRRSPRRGLPRGWWWLAPAGALAAAAVMLLMLDPAPHAELALEVAVVQGGGPARRGTEAQPGDRLQLSAQVGKASHAELRVYRRDAELVMSCSSAPPCRRAGERLEAELTLGTVGSYQTLVLVSENPLPAPAAGLDADAGAALAAGARVRLGEEVRVR